MDIQQENGKIYVPLKNKWLIETPEELVRQKYICKLVNVYGYSLKQMSQEIEVANSHRGQGRARADIVIWKSEKDKLENKKAFIVVECKAENIKIREEDYYQGYNYASWAGATFFITTNEKETKFFNVDKEYLPKKLDEIIDIPNASIINNENEITKLIKQTKKFERDEFAKLLFKCHNIIRNNDKLSPEAAFDEISKILFMKIRYERNPSEESIFSLKKFQRDEKHYEENVRPYLKGDDKNLPYIQILFRQTKEEFRNDELFDENEIIKIKKISFESIVKELEKYNLSDTSDDIKGIAFEEFLGKTFRGELGQFFTPRTIVDFMVNILDPKEGELICDPCCGSGGFLINTFEHIKENIENDINSIKEKIKENYFNEDFEKLSAKDKDDITKNVNKYFSKVNEDLIINNSKGRLYNLSYNCIFGVDANPRMARTAKMNMIMHGDGHGGVHHNDGLLNINGIFQNRFDVILTNPPFGSRIEKNLVITENDKYTDEEKIQYYISRYGEEYNIALRQINDNIGKSILDLFEVGKFSSITEVVFMERCLDLLKPGGRLGIVLPEGVLNNGQQMEKVREYFEGKAKIILITSIPQEVFMASGANVKPSLVFVKKFTIEESKKYEEISEYSRKEIEEKFKHKIDNENNKKVILDNELVEIRNNIKDIKKKIKKGIEANDKLSVFEEKMEELKGQIKVINKEIKENIKNIHELMERELKRLIKERFDYEIPIAQVEKAGIDSKGAKSDNELIALQSEYKEFKQKNKLWEDNSIKFNYVFKKGELNKSQSKSDSEVLFDE
ncbi:N-6 DNA methylase [Clostridium botulinum]|nr:N-6 DNA methylase [Clostridium botulinum]NFO40924.1 N-6 DNA methylase [Clostridium botulinum]